MAIAVFVGCLKTCVHVQELNVMATIMEETVVLVEKPLLYGMTLAMEILAKTTTSCLTMSQILLSHHLIAAIQLNKNLSLLNN